ncbi:uncharacterized protein BDZ99DRAFT_460609 [Mytilinidion resinicola]|uniref:Uncharacterized protein n=1 Tax=Mytilinidion resinicola TaxID=574789 RepID=A0A6A6YWQ1_9PEZI|nr:uncharacterized protein BDZ99DRAFT_460609 [Mytilinidion resinicola]KAF2813356.1 hypothetical protein BDZ99DRAFT_460609 [Mytilinidion resinicola]
MSVDSSESLAFDGIYYPLFVTANLPIELLNSTLTRALTERFNHNDPSWNLVGSPWVLISCRTQTVFSYSTKPPVKPFQSDFIGASIDELGTLVASSFGKNGRGSKGVDYLRNDRFGILDARTAEDDTRAVLRDQRAPPPCRRGRAAGLLGRGYEIRRSVGPV